jgi:type VI secretion system protein ImpB
MSQDKSGRSYRERVSLVYKSHVSQSDKEVELPFKLLVLGSFSGGGNPSSFEDRRPVRVTRENFDDILKAQNLTLNLLAENFISPQDKAPIKISLNPASLKDFTPAALAGSLPPLAGLQQRSRSLRQTKKLLLDRPALAAALLEILRDPARRNALETELAALKTAAETEPEAIKTDAGTDTAPLAAGPAPEPASLETDLVTEPKVFKTDAGTDPAPLAADPAPEPASLKTGPAAEPAPLGTDPAAEPASLKTDPAAEPAGRPETAAETEPAARKRADPAAGLQEKISSGS